ncbi:trk system potassium uptake protein trkA, partial [Escherichia coli 95.0183]
ALSSCN